MARNRKKNRIPFAERRLKYRALGELAPKFGLAIGPRFTANSDFSATFPFKRSRIAIVVSGLFLIAFSFPLVGVVGELVADSDDSLFSLVSFLFLLFWGLGWSVGVAVLALVFLTLCFGRETLEVKDSSLILRLGIPGVGFGATYPGSLIRNFRREQPDEQAGSGWRGEHLAFDIAGDTVGFGSAIDAERAQHLLAELIRLFPEQDQAAPEIPPAPVAEQQASMAKQSGAAPSLDLTPLRWHSLSSLALIAANMIPLLGVLFFTWDVGEIMLLFWAESAVIGIYNLLKMIKIGKWATLFYGPFFVGHYGGFMAGHLLFIYGFFGNSFGENTDIDQQQLFADFVILSPALLAFFISHGISYFNNFLGRREYVNKDISAQMGQPYKRIIIMHVTIIFGGFLAMMLESALPALLLLIILKVAADLRGHLREHGAAAIGQVDKNKNAKVAL